jgi:hypothetical protein
VNRSASRAILSRIPEPSSAIRLHPGRPHLRTTAAHRPSTARLAHDQPIASRAGGGGISAQLPCPVCPSAFLDSACNECDYLNHKPLPDATAHHRRRGTNIAGRRRPGSVQRLGVIAGFTLAGAGAGLTAATATVGNTWARTACAIAGGAAGLVGGTMTDRFHQRRQARAEAERQRSSVLSSVVTDRAREGSIFDLLLATSVS